MNRKLIATSIALLAFAAAGLFADEVPDQDLDVPYEPSHPKVVQGMLQAGQVKAGDVLFDLGCGDGRIVIAAAKLGATAHGIDIDEQRLQEARERAVAEGVTGRATFSKEDIFKTDLSRATVVTMYLLDEINLKMRPLLFRMLKPGTRIVTHAFNMNDWQPDQTIINDRARDKKIMFWRIPAAAGGTWTSPDGKVTVELRQRFQTITGKLRYANKEAVLVGRMDGKAVSLKTGPGSAINTQLSGTIEGSEMQVSIPGVLPKGTLRLSSAPLEGEWKIDVKGNDSLTGKLKLTRTQGRYTAEFTADKKYEIYDLYVWGSSVYFRVPVYGDESFAIYHGNLGPDGGSGEVGNETASFGKAWTAVKTR
jgi:hypothetical protein